MPVERRGQAIRALITLVNWQQEEPTGCGEERQLLMDGTSRVSREAQARFREGLGVQFHGATRPGPEIHKSLDTRVPPICDTRVATSEVGGDAGTPVSDVSD
jgi:hypothetical protein